MIAHGARLEFCLKCLVTHMTLFVSYEAHPVSREMRLAFHKKCPLHSCAFGGFSRVVSSSLARRMFRIAHVFSESRVSRETRPVSRLLCISFCEK